MAPSRPVILALLLVCSATAKEAEWHKRGTPSKTCEWVGKDAQARCGFARGDGTFDRGARGEDGTFASESCVVCTGGASELPAWAENFGMKGVFKSDPGVLVSGETEPIIRGKAPHYDFVPTSDPLSYAMYKTNPCQEGANWCGPDGYTHTGDPVPCGLTFAGTWFLACADLNDIAMFIFTPVAVYENTVTAMVESMVETGPKYDLQDGTENSFQKAMALSRITRRVTETGWHKHGTPSKTCAWVGEDAEARCGFARDDRGARGQDGTFASDSCGACYRFEVPSWADGIKGVFQSDAGALIVAGETEVQTSGQNFKEFGETSDPMLFFMRKTHPCTNDGSASGSYAWCGNDGYTHSDAPVACALTHFGGWVLLCVDNDDITIRMFAPVLDGDVVTELRDSTIETGPKYRLADGSENVRQTALAKHAVYYRADATGPTEVDLPSWASSGGIEGLFEAKGKLVLYAGETEHKASETRITFVATDDPSLYLAYKTNPCESGSPGCVDGYIHSDKPISCVLTHTAAWFYLCNDNDDIAVLILTPSTWDGDTVTAMRQTYLETGPVYTLEDGSENKYQSAQVDVGVYTRVEDSE